MNTTPEFAEREQDTSGVKLTKHDLDEALDDLIDRLFEGKSVNGTYLENYVAQFAEEVAAELIMRSAAIRGHLAGLIRRELEDSDAVRERAAELAQGEE
jgi:hypothetical protein